jgi:hypothetical protein
MWIKAFQDGTVEVHPVAHHAGFLIRARSAAAVFLRDAKTTAPPDAQAMLENAARSYDQVVARITELRDSCKGEEPDLQLGATILSAAYDAERAAIASLQEALGAL